MANGPGWPNRAWQRVDYETAWAPFEARYGFRPGIDPATWPAIREPAPSTTYDLTPIVGAERTAPEITALETLVLDAWIEVLAPGEWLWALDWQHPSYRFWPHEQLAEGEPWRVSPYPDSNYHLLLTSDMGAGVLGHPWEKTLCVFGAALLEALHPLLAGWLPVLRQRP